MAATASRYGRFALATFSLFLPAVPAAAVQLPDGTRVEKVDFERHVQALLGRQGCNAGACHGSFQGKGGLYLSLFGYSPEKDHRALTRESAGRRVSVANPDQSLVLLKATGQVPHGGGKRFDKGSWQYQVIREWVAAGAPWQPGSGDVVRTEVTPGEHLFDKPGQTGRFRVLVHFADGSKEDLTWFSDFRVNDDYVAEPADGVAVRGLRPGDTAVVISYRGQVQGVRALVKVPPAQGFVYPQVPEVNYVDREVFAKLKKLNVVPSELSDDGEFLRRASLDTVGSLPAPGEVRAFLADKDPDKRSKKIDELLAHPLHAALWATKFSDITGNNIDAMEQPQQLRVKRSKMWHDWFRRRVADNTPYDEIVRGILTATSRDGKPPEEWVKEALAIEQQAQKGFDTDYAKRASLDLFWRRTAFTPEQMAEHTAAAFLGVRLECAQCHKHPFDRWTQADYRSYANVFAGVRFAVSQETQQAVAKELAERRKAAAEALAAVDKEFADRKKAAEEKADKENAERRKAAEEKVEKEIAERRKTELAKLGDDPDGPKHKAAVDKLERMLADRRKEALAAADKDNASRKRTALAPVEQEIARRKAAVQAQFDVRNQPQLREVYVTNQPPPRQPNRPDTSEYKPKALGGPGIENKGDPRQALFEWLRRPDNPYFARSFVNRVWAHYFGLGLVDPVDNFSVANPSSNDRLLDALAKDFVAQNYDLRHLERTILRSRTYQLSATPNETNKHDRNGYARSYPRRMMAEVVVDALNSALGASENFGTDAPPNSRAVEVAPNRVQNQTLANVFRLFGRPPRTATCDCERASEPALPQTLYLMTDPAVLGKITGGRLKSLLTQKRSDEEAVEELFLATLTRFPTEKEKRRALEHVRGKQDRQAGFVDVTWALINTREFILNH